MSKLTLPSPMPTAPDPAEFATAAPPVPNTPLPVRPEPSEAPLLIEGAGSVSGMTTAPPSARLFVTSVLRTSVLLAALPDEAARTLLALLTFLTPDGRLQAAAPQIAAALSIPERRARERMRNLAKVSHRGRQVAYLVERESGLDALSINPALVAVVEVEEEDKERGAHPEPHQGGFREEIVAHSRAAHAHTRAEVERMVMAQLGHAPEEADDTPEGRVRRQLSAYGLSREEAEDMLLRFPLERIERQLSWMGMRQARSPRRFLIAAIENGYDPPPGTPIREPVDGMG